jgi:hypothetical protein
MTAALHLGLTAVILAVAEATPRVVTVRSGFEIPPGFGAGDAPPPHRDALPGAPFEPGRFRTLQDGVRAVAAGVSGVSLRYVEQLYTFGDRFRDPHEAFGGPRAVTVGYLALVRAEAASGPAAQWRDLYDFFPWEDWREARPAVLDTVILPALRRWAAGPASAAEGERRNERIDLAFAAGSSGPGNSGPGSSGPGGGGMDAGDKDAGPIPAGLVLERYELLYEAGLVVESYRDRDLLRRAGLETGALAPDMPRALGRPMARDGRRILACALDRLRGTLKIRPLVFELLPPVFTLHQLQQVVESLAGARLHKQNFRRLVLTGGLVEATGIMETQTGGRPAGLFRYRRHAIHQRTSTGALPEPEPDHEASDPCMS